MTDDSSASSPHRRKTRRKPHPHIRATLDNNIVASIDGILQLDVDCSAKITSFMMHLLDYYDDCKKYDVKSNLYDGLTIFAQKLQGQNPTDGNAVFLSTFATQLSEQDATTLPELPTTVECCRKITSSQKDFTDCLINFTLHAQAITEEKKLDILQRDLLVAAAIAAYQEVVKPKPAAEEKPKSRRDYRANPDGRLNAIVSDIQKPSTN